MVLFEKPKIILDYMFIRLKKEKNEKYFIINN